MTTRQNKNRQSIRLKEFDYSAPGWYFVTICIKKRAHYFGHTENGKMILSDIGKNAAQCWLEIPKHYPNTVLNEFTIMPNHLHGIINIVVGAQYLVPFNAMPDSTQHLVPDPMPDSMGVQSMRVQDGMRIGVQSTRVQDIEPLRDSVGVKNIESQRDEMRENKFQHIIPGSIGAIVRGFKIGVTKWCRNNKHEYFAWQRNFYERIIRDERELNNVRNYIMNNPVNWENDIENLQFMKQLLEAERDFKAQKHYDQIFLA